MAARVDELGPAVEGFPLSGAALRSARLHLVSRNLGPTRLAVVDIDTASVVDRDTVPDGDGAWGVTATPSGDVYLGQFGARGRGNLYRYRNGRVDVVAALDSDYLWALAAAADGRVFGVASPPMVFRYDPVANRADIVGVIDPAAGDRVRSVAVLGTTLIVGGARSGRALLLAANLDGSGRRSVLPPALAGDAQVYSLHAAGGSIAAGTTGRDRAAPAVALLDPRNPGAASVTQLQRETLVDALTIDDGIVWCTARPSGGLYRFDPARRQLTRPAVPVPGAETRAVFVRGGLVIGASATGAVWSYRPSNGAITVQTSATLGLVPRPERAQSLTVASGTVYAGGNFSLQARRLSDGRVQRLFLPGEAKDAVAVGSTVYLALYPIGEVWTLRVGEDRARRLTALPTDQLRPLSIAYDPALDCIAVTSTSDGAATGLHVLDPVTGRIGSATDPLGPDQTPAGLATDSPMLYLGGSGASMSLGAWDLRAGRLAWRLDNVAEGGGFLLGLSVLSGQVYGFTTRGWVVQVDPSQPRVVRRRRVAALGGRLVSSGGRLYGATPDAVLRIDPGTLVAEPDVTGLNSEIFGWPMLAVDSAGARYGLRGRTLIRLRDPL